MLASISSGLNPSALVCIKDSVEWSGHELLKAFIQNAIYNKENQTHIFCYENSIRRLKDNLKNCNEGNVHFHDCFSDHRGWINSTFKENEDSEKTTKDNCMLNIIKQIQMANSDRNVVIIDSLTPLIMNVGFTRCYQELHKLARSKNDFRVLQCICLVHEDVLPDVQINLPYLDHLASSSIRIEPKTNGSNVVSIIHRKLGGKIINEMEFYSIDLDGKVTSQKLPPVSGRTIEKSVDATDNILPQDLTTFKLSLGNQEKQARSELVLPYIRTNKEKGGKVFYQPDAADDWDEEDPDDDLDV